MPDRRDEQGAAPKRRRISTSSNHFARRREVIAGVHLPVVIWSISSRSTVRQAIVRTACGIIAASPPLAALAGFVLMIILGDPKPGEISVGAVIFTPAIVLTFFVTLPCGYVAFKGIGSPKDNDFHAKCVGQIVAGALCVGFGFLLTWLSTLLPFLFILFNGVIAIGIVTFMLGVLSLVSSRELLREMSEIKVSLGKRKAK